METMQIVATGLPATVGDYQLALNATFAGGEAFGKAQQRTWIGLTDDEIMASYNEPRSDAEMIAFGRELEAKLKEKNT